MGKASRPVSVPTETAAWGCRSRKTSSPRDLNGEVALEPRPVRGGAVVITFTPRLVAVEPFGVL